MSNRQCRPTPEEFDTQEWELTFSDMLTLLLTFFVFLIAVSAFKTSDYRKFWENFTLTGNVRPTPTKSFSVGVIKGINLPRLAPEARTLLNEMEEVFADRREAEGLEVYYTENKISLVVSESLMFSGGASRLREELKPLLLALIPALRATPYMAAIEGHTDNLVSEKIDNMKLSLDRALEVARFLIAGGLDKRKVSVSGYGPFRPVADNHTAEGRSRNRRVEFNILINND